jgi:anti-sigma28 factor (negative regulator of flagellin synthesis)
MNSSFNHELNPSAILRYDTVPTEETFDDFSSTSMDHNIHLSGMADMEVNGIGPIQRPQQLGGTRPSQEISTPETNKPIQTDDQVEISSIGQKLNSIEGSSEVREARIAQIRASIESGEYETLDKLEASLDGLLNDIQDSSE